MLINTEVRKEYSRLAADYDQRWAKYIEATTRETLRDLPVEQTEVLLDLGCGTGALLAALAESQPGLSSVGLDPVDEMLAKARRRLPESVSLCQGDAQQLPFAESCFDCVVSVSAWHYLRQPEAVLAEIRRVLKAEGRLVLTDWSEDFWTMKLLDLYLRWRKGSHYRTWGSKALVTLLEQQGFRVIKTRTYKIDAWWGLMQLTAKPDRSFVEVPDRQR